MLLLIQEVKTMSNPHAASNLIRPMTVPEYGNAANCVHQLLVYIFEVCFTISGWSSGLPKTQVWTNQYLELGLNQLVTIKVTLHQNCSFYFNETP